MGEMADFYVDQMMDAFPEWGSPYSQPRTRARAESVTCRNCGERKLAWALNENSKYYLVSTATGAAHVCNPVCEFEDLTKAAP